jgi:hypothetical protein
MWSGGPWGDPSAAAPAPPDAPLGARRASELSTKRGVVQRLVDNRIDGPRPAPYRPASALGCAPGNAVREGFGETRP